MKIENSFSSCVSLTNIITYFVLPVAMTLYCDKNNKLVIDYMSEQGNNNKLVIEYISARKCPLVVY